MYINDINIYEENGGTRTAKEHCRMLTTDAGTDATSAKSRPGRGDAVTSLHAVEDVDEKGSAVAFAP